MNRRRRLAAGLEKLERRELLAGNVTVNVSFVGRTDSGILSIKGDNAPNTIAVWTGPDPNQLIVAGGLDSAGKPTTVNGQTGPVVFNGVTNGITAGLLGGNDQILITHIVPVVGDVRVGIDSGFGNDIVTFRGTVPKVADIKLNQSRLIPYGPVNITGAAVSDDGGRDVVRAYDTAISGSFRANFYGGNDTVVFDGTLNTVARDAIFDLAGSGDTVRLNRTNVGRNILLSNDFHPDALGNTTIGLFDVTVKGRTDLRTNGNNLNIVIDGGNTPAQRSSIANLVVAGSGQDSIVIEHSDIKFASLDLGAQDDSVKFVDAVFEQLAVYLGDGNDTLTVGNTRVTRRTSFNGGAGRDQFISNGGNSLAGASIVSFEQ